MERFKYTPSDFFSIFERVQAIKLRAYDENPKEIGSGRLFRQLFPSLKDHAWEKENWNRDDDHYKALSPKALLVVVKKDRTEFYRSGVHLLTLYQDKDHYIEDAIAAYVNQWMGQVVKELVTHELRYAEMDNKKKQEATSSLYE